MKDKYADADVIILLKNTIVNKIRNNDLDGAIMLLESPEIQDTLKHRSSFPEDDFMYDFVSELHYDTTMSRKIKTWDLDTYNDLVQVYNDYSEICQAFILGQSNTILSEIYSILVEWREYLCNYLFEPRRPVFRVTNEDLPF